MSLSSLSGSDLTSSIGGVLEVMPALQELVDALPDAMIALSTGGRLLAVNAAFYDMWNMPMRLRRRPEALRILWHFLAQLSQPAWVSRQLEDALSRAPEAGTCMIVAADNRKIECRHRPVRHSGLVMGLVISMRDMNQALIDVSQPLVLASNDGDGGAQPKLNVPSSLGVPSCGETGVQSLVEALPPRVWVENPLGGYLACEPAFGQACGLVHEPMAGRRGDQFARDFTRKRRTQHLLERSNRLLAVSEAMTHVGGCELDLVTGTVFWTDQMYRLLEISPTAYTPSVETALRFFAPEHVAVIGSAIEEAGREGKTHDLEVQMITATGRRIWVHWVSSVLIEAERIVKRIWTVQDITRRKQADQEQVQSREAQARMAEQLDMAVSGAKLGLWSIHLPSDQALLSGQWEAILGVSFDEEPRPLEMRTQLIHPGDRDAAREAFKRHLKGDLAEFEHELRARHAGGQWIWLRMRGRVVKRSQAGRPLLVAGIARDIGAEREVRHAASRQQQMLQAMIDGIETGILVNDGERVIYMNAMFRRLLGYGEVEELNGLHMDDLISPEERAASVQRRQIVESGGCVPIGWVNLITRRGETVQTALSLSSIMLGYRRLYVATASRPSEQQMLDVRIRDTQTRFERLLVSELEKQQAHIARELHDSLGSELAAVSLMVGGLQPLAIRNKRLAQGLMRVQGQVQSAVGITRMLARGLMPVDAYPGALWDALDQLASSLSTLRGIACEVKRKGQDGEISAEVRNHLYRIAQEAITNAIRHGKASRIEIRVDEVDARWYMDVEADGSSFDASAALGPGNKGMGLRSMMARAKTIGGSVEFAAKAMGGSCVTVYWPKRSVPG